MILDVINPYARENYVVGAVEHSDPPVPESSDQSEVSLKQQKERAKLKHKIEQSGEVLPINHFFCQYLHELLQDDTDIPEGLGFWVVDGDGSEMYYSPAANVVAVGRGFFKDLLKRSEDRFLNAPSDSQLRNNPFAKQLSAASMYLAEDHIIQVIKHEIRHGIKYSEERNSDPDTRYSITQWLGRRHQEEYDADIWSIKSSAHTHNPWALSDVFWLLQYDYGLISWSHPEMVDRIRAMEQVLTDDDSPLYNTTKNPTPIPPRVLDWLSAETTVYNQTDQLFACDAATLHNQLMSASDFDIFWKNKLAWEHQVSVEAVKWIAQHQITREVVLLGLALGTMTFSNLFEQVDMGVASIDLLNLDNEHYKESGSDEIIRKHTGIQLDNNMSVVDEGVRYIIPPNEMVLLPKLADAVRQLLPQPHLPIALEYLERYWSAYEKAGKFLLVHMDELIEKSGDQVKAELELRKNLIKRALNKQLEPEDVALLLQFNFPHRDVQLEKMHRAQRQAKSPTDRHTSLDRGRTAERVDFIHDQFAVNDCLESLTLEFSGQLVATFPEEEERAHIEKFSQLLVDKGVAVEHAIVFSEEILTRTDYRQIFQILENLDIPVLEEYKAILSEINTEISLTLSSQNRLRNLTIASFLTRMLGQELLASELTDRLVRTIKGHFHFRNQQNSLSSRVHEIEYFLSKLYEKKVSQLSDTQLNPFLASSEFSYERWREMAENSTELNYRLAAFAAREWIKSNYSGAAVSENVIDAINRTNNYHSAEFSIHEAMSLLDCPYYSHPYESVLGHVAEYFIDKVATDGCSDDLISFFKKLYEVSQSSYKPHVLQEFFDATIFNLLTQNSLIVSSSDVDMSEPDIVKSVFVQAVQQFRLVFGCDYSMKFLPKEFYNHGVAKYRVFTIAVVTKLTSSDLLDLEQTVGEFETQPLAKSEDGFSLAEELRITQLLRENATDEEHADLVLRFCERGNSFQNQLENKFSRRLIELFKRQYLDFDSALGWVLDNFDISLERDMLILGIHIAFGVDLNDEVRGQLVQDLDFYGNEDAGYPFGTHREFKELNSYHPQSEYDHSPIPFDSLRGTGLIAEQYADLLTRKRFFAEEPLEYPFGGSSRISYVGSAYQRLIAKYYLARENEILSVNTFQEKIDVITKIEPLACIVRDIYLEIVSRDFLQQADHQSELATIPKLLTLFTETCNYRQRLATRLLLLEEHHNGYLWQSFQDGMSRINELFPETSVMRAHFMRKLACSVSLVPEQAEQLRVELLVNQSDEHTVVSDGVLAFNYLAQKNRSEKMLAVTWLLGVDTVKPISVLEREEIYDGHLDSMPRYFQSLLPEEQEVLLKRLLLGEEGVFDLDSMTGPERVEATAIKQHVLETVAQKLLSDGKDTEFQSEIFVSTLMGLPAMNAVQIFSKVVAYYFQQQQLSLSVSAEELAAVFLAELGTPGIKAAQSISELTAVPDSYRQSLGESVEYAGGQIPITALFTQLENRELLSSGNGLGFSVVRINKLLGNASNKQAAVLEIHVHDSGLRRQLGLANESDQLEVVGRFKRASAQKTWLVDQYFETGRDMLRLAAKYFGKQVPTQLVSNIERLTQRELAFKEEEVFTRYFSEQIHEVGEVGSSLVRVPRILYADDELIIETLAPGSSLREKYETASLSVIKSAHKAILVTLLYVIMQHGSLHADTTTGNIFLDDSNPEALTINLLDRGMHETLDENQRKAVMDLLIGLVEKKKRTVAKACSNLGWKISSKYSFDGNFFNNVVTLTEAVTYSEEVVPDIMSNVATTLFKMSKFFDRLDKDDLEEVVKELKQRIELPVWTILRHLFSK